MKSGLKESAAKKELLETAALDMQTTNPTDLAGVRDLVRSVQAAVRTLNVKGSWSRENYPEKELAEKFGGAVKGVFDALQEGKIEDPLNLAHVLDLYRAEIEPHVVESIRVHVLGYMRGNLKDAMQEGREIHPNIFTMHQGSVTPWSPEESTRLEILQAAYIMAFTMQYLEHEALVMNQKFPKKVGKTDFESIRLAAKYQSVETIKLLIQPEKFAPYLNARGISWTPADVQKNIRPSDYFHLLHGSRDVLESSYRFAFAINTLQHPDALVKVLLSRGKDAKEIEDLASRENKEKEIRALLASKSAVAKIAQWTINSDKEPNTSVQNAVVSVLDATHVFDDSEKFASFVNVCLRKRVPDPKIIVSAESVHSVVSERDIFWAALNTGSAEALKKALEGFLTGTRNALHGRISQDHLLKRLEKLSIVKPVTST